MNKKTKFKEGDSVFFIGNIEDYPYDFAQTILSEEIGRVKRKLKDENGKNVLLVTLVTAKSDNGMVMTKDFIIYPKDIEQ